MTVFVNPLYFLLSLQILLFQRKPHDNLSLLLLHYDVASEMLYAVYYQMKQKAVPCHITVYPSG
jgi:hypothetical protein